MEGELEGCMGVCEGDYGVDESRRDELRYTVGVKKKELIAELTVSFAVLFEEGIPCTRMRQCDHGRAKAGTSLVVLPVEAHDQFHFGDRYIHLHRVSFLRAGKAARYRLDNWESCSPRLCHSCP